MEKETEKKQYEAAFVSADETSAKKFSDDFKKAGAEIVFESPLSKMRLAYPVDKREEAYFGFLHFNLEPAELPRIEKQLRVHSPVLRFLIVTPPFMKQKERRQYEPRKKISPVSSVDKKPASHLSNEALEKQLKEILQ